MFGKTARDHDPQPTTLVTWDVTMYCSYYNSNNKWLLLYLLIIVCCGVRYCTYYRLARHTIDTHYTFPISNVNNCSASYLNLVVVSDRNASPVPLRAFVNSLLLYASRPIRLNVVSKVGIPWLEAFLERIFSLQT